ncbi:hypothetical protein HIM_02172 [Hirsutella minnesotensis 3608]|nr:hypothetical protein HIM_02172 [Hirsutella minnesotensis 3608]
MTGVKREWDGKARARPASDAPRGRFHDMFETFRNELDEHHDRRERIIKASRDVTAQSKKIVKTLSQEFPASTEKDVSSRMAEITKLLQSIAADVQSVNRYRYAWSLRCLEELVEALSMAHYLRHQRLITPAEAQAAVPADILLTPHDYMYGIFDLFGELMRFSTVQRAAVLPGAVGDAPSDGKRPILRDIQELGCAFEMLPHIPSKDYWSKMEAMRQSVRKVENLGYGLVVRGSERPQNWVPDMKDETAGRVSPV